MSGLLAHRGLLLGAPGAATDPDFASVVLLLPGADATDLSSYGHTATVGSSITFETANPHPVFGTSIRTNGLFAETWWYTTAAPEWRYDPIFTLDFSIYFDALPGNWPIFTPSDYSRFVQFVGGGGMVNVNLQGKWTGPVVPAFTTGTWYDCRFVCDGTNKSFYTDGVQVDSNTEGFSADGSDKDFDLIDDLGATAQPQLRLCGVRYTQGVARNDPTDLTCPVPTVPWPTS